MDNNLSFGEHITYVTGKAQKADMAVTRLMPRIRGSTESRRRILGNVEDLIVLHAALVWAQACAVKKYKEQLRKALGIMAIRTSRSYRTVSTDGLLVVAGAIPIDLIAKERQKYMQT